MIYKTGLLDYGFRHNNFADFRLDAICECVQNKHDHVGQDCSNTCGDIFKRIKWRNSKPVSV